MRQHFEHLAAACGLLAFALFVSYFHSGSAAHLSGAGRSGTTLKPVPSDAFFATSTFPGLAEAPSLESLLHPAASSSAPAAATSTKSSPSPAPVPHPVPAPQPVPAPAAVPSPAPAPAASSTEQAASPSHAPQLTALKGSIANILCFANDGSLHSISGSGVFIDSRGIILTAAHVAQMTLLEQYLGSDKVSCVVRVGNPARTAYLVRPIYIPDAWLKANPTTLISSQPTGTGERDYALLAVTGSATSATLPPVFPGLPLTMSTPHKGDEVYLGSYGSQELTTAQVRTALSPTLATSTVDGRYTFNTDTVDVLSIAGNAAAQEGSSGGAVADDAGELVGLITTSDIAGPFSSREMRAITPNYISRSFDDDTGKEFISYFGGTDVSTLVNAYAPTAEAQGEFLAKSIGL